MNTSIEVFIDGVAYSYAMERKLDTKNTEGIHFWRNSNIVQDIVEVLCCKIDLLRKN